LGKIVDLDFLFQIPKEEARIIGDGRGRKILRFNNRVERAK
jgi:hypothetical protein